MPNLALDSTRYVPVSSALNSETREEEREHLIELQVRLKLPGVLGNASRLRAASPVVLHRPEA